MLANLNDEILHVKHTLADMYIGLEADRQLMGTKFTHWLYDHNTAIGTIVMTDIFCRQSGARHTIDSHYTNWIQYQQVERNTRGRDWHHMYENRRRIAQRSLARKLTPTTQYRQWACPTMVVSSPTQRTTHT
jgi:hypothetical protein